MHEETEVYVDTIHEHGLTDFEMDRIIQVFVDTIEKMIIRRELKHETPFSYRPIPEKQQRIDDTLYVSAHMKDGENYFIAERLINGELTIALTGGIRSSEE